MAKFIKTYEINLGDYIRFKTISGEVMCGTVQCISELPDIFVEVGDPHLDNYNRYRISVNLVEDVIHSADGDSFPMWQWDDVSFEPKEAIEFVYDDDLNNKIYTHLKE